MAIAATDIRAVAALGPERAFRRAGYSETLRRTGHKLVGLCPFHAEQDGSFTITLDADHAGAWHCFGCRAGGDVLTFYSKLHGVHDFGATCE